MKIELFCGCTRPASHKLYLSHAHLLNAWFIYTHRSLTAASCFSLSSFTRYIYTLVFFLTPLFHFFFFFYCKKPKKKTFVPRSQFRCMRNFFQFHHSDSRRLFIISLSMTTTNVEQNYFPIARPCAYGKLQYSQKKRKKGKK